LLVLGAINGAEARLRDSHPFTGENSDKNVIFHEDGGMTARATPVADYWDKYDELVTKRKYKTYKSGYTQAYNHLFGPTQSEIEFEASLKAHDDHKRLRSK
jgi:hypothetical protein